MRRTRYKLPKTQSVFTLNITSMTDMFTILLVFLLQTYSTSAVEVLPEKDINLPVSNAELSPVKALNVSVSRSELKIEGRTIASLDNGEFQGSDIDQKDPNFIKPLFQELRQLQGKPGADQSAAILLQADSGLTYQALRKVMYTSSMAGFPQLKMATVVGE